MGKPKVRDHRICGPRAVSLTESDLLPSGLNPSVDLVWKLEEELITVKKREVISLDSDDDITDVTDDVTAMETFGQKSKSGRLLRSSESGPDVCRLQLRWTAKKSAKNYKNNRKKVLSTSNLKQFVSSNSKKSTSKKSIGQTQRFITRDSTPDECIILDWPKCNSTKQVFWFFKSVNLRFSTFVVFQK